MRPPRAVSYFLIISSITSQRILFRNVPYARSEGLTHGKTFPARVDMNASSLLPIALPPTPPATSCINSPPPSTYLIQSWPFSTLRMSVITPSATCSPPGAIARNARSVEARTSFSWEGKSMPPCLSKKDRSTEDTFALGIFKISRRSSLGLYPVRSVSMRPRGPPSHKLTGLRRTSAPPTPSPKTSASRFRLLDVGTAPWLSRSFSAFCALNCCQGSRRSLGVSPPMAPTSSIISISRLTPR